MRHLQLATATCLLLLAHTGPVSGQIRSVLPDETVLNRYGLTRAWWAQANINPSRDTVKHLVVDEEVVIVQATSGLVTAYEVETGRELWKAQLGNQDSASFPAITNTDMVMIAVGMKIFAITKFEGDVAWQLVMPVHPSASPELDDDRLFIPSLDGSVFAMNLKRIHRLYNEGKLPDWTAQTQDWRFQSSGKMTYPPVSNSRVLAFANERNRLNTITTAAREPVFEFRTDAAISAELTMTDDYVYMASEDFRLYCVNINTGGLRWAPFTAGLPIRHRPMVVGEYCWVTPVRGGMYTLSTTTGRMAWPWRPEVSELHSVSERYLFASDRLRNLVLLDRLNQGKPVATLPLRDYSVRIHNLRTDRLIMATPSGRVVSIREKKLDFPLYHLDPDRRPIMPKFESDADPDVTDDPNAAPSPDSGTN